MALDDLSPMLAALHEELPRGSGWIYEPKFDGFRCLVHRHGGSAVLRSRNGRDLTRLFADVAQAAVQELPPGSVVDGELVYPDGSGVRFEGLLERLSRTGRSAKERGCGLVAFDVLVVAGEDVRDRRLAERRGLLQELIKPHGVLTLTPNTGAPEEAERWLSTPISGIEGVVANRTESLYRSGQRGWIKVKRRHSADVVVGGIRGDRLPLGLYDGGALHHVGETTAVRPDVLAAIAGKTSWSHGIKAFSGRRPGVGRWGGDRYDDWWECEPLIVVEVSYTQLEGPRFRHAVRIVRLRPDKDAAMCGFDQLEVRVTSRSAGTCLDSEAISRPR